MTELLEWCLRLAGLLLVVNGLAHVYLPRILGWRSGLASLSRIDTEVSYGHVYFVGLACTTWGVLAVAAAPGLASPVGTLTHVTLVAGAVFCASRLAIQFIFDTNLWKRYRFGRPAFWLSALWWTCEVLAFLLPLFF